MNKRGVQPTRLLLARHGQTVWHHDNRYAGSSDVELNEAGLREAQALARRAERERLDLVVCSPLIRAVETAQPAAEACGVELVVDERLHEVDFGEWEGKTLEEVRAADPIAAKRFEADPVKYGFPGGEPLPEAARRALEALRELDAEHPGEKVLVVVHNTLIRLVVCSLLGIPLKNYRRRFPNLVSVAITEVRLSEGGGALYTFNDAEHLWELKDATRIEERRS
jgi:probable phosphoglycerate mutase